MLANSRDCKACMIVGTGGRCDGVIRIELKIEQILRTRQFHPRSIEKFCIQKLDEVNAPGHNH